MPDGKNHWNEVKFWAAGYIGLRFVIWPALACLIAQRIMRSNSS